MATAQNNQMAIFSAVAGAVGWMGVPIAASVVAIVCGHIARQQIRQTGEEGDTLALIGLVLGYAHIALLCVGLAFFVAFYGAILAFFAANGLAQQ